MLVFDLVIQNKKYVIALIKMELIITDEHEHLVSDAKILKQIAKKINKSDKLKTDILYDIITSS